MKVYLSPENISDLKKDASGTILWYNRQYSEMLGKPDMVAKYHDMEIYIAEK